MHDFMLSFHPSVSVLNEGDSSVTLKKRNSNLKINKVSPGIRSVIYALLSQRMSEQELTDIILEQDGVQGLTIWFLWQQRLQDLGFFSYTLQNKEICIATLFTINSKFNFVQVDEDTNYIVSRFVYCHRHKERNNWLIESPTSRFSILLYGSVGFELLSELSKPVSLNELRKLYNGEKGHLAEGFLTLLKTAGMLSEVSSEGHSLEEENSFLEHWEFHDLLFHSRSRTGRHDEPYGDTYRFMKRFPPLPALKHNMSNDAIPLHKPDLDFLIKEDLPFTSVLEKRMSIRKYDHQCITDKQLGEFLYRTARVRHWFNKGDIMPYEITNRPYPNGGAVYELEIYITINNCKGIHEGIYYYQPLNHELLKIKNSQAVEKLLKHKIFASGELPQILITITSRFQRVSWKYQSMAYALTLKNVGALYQTMYLVGTAMGLAPCGLGGGNSDTFVELTGLNYYEESPVGEFALGSCQNNNSFR